ncbi:pericentrin isoform X6 [Pteropus vampyrus]|uniref:Pericentrin isoform X6 n=1 Tax=Pteropus vampyrus TaxID=132908 RepID=A0A6P6C2M7_PTEVA|nr:pericentrin isoform X6 [Pteropus vampyrus]
MEDEQEQRRRKVEAGRAKLAQFRQRKTKGDCAHSKKKTAKGKSSAVAAPVPEERPVAPEGGALLGGGDARQSAACSGALDEAGATQDCEQAREPEVAEPMSRHGDETDGQQPTMAVQLQTQPAPPLELEALRLSLSHMHTARLELTQATLQKEKEAALTELRDTLSGRHAQELALLQSRWRLELELAREQHAREREVLVRRRCQETAELEEKLQSEVEKNVQAVEILKRDWESERDQCLENLRKELSAQHQSEVDHLRSQFEKELAEQKAELEKTFQAKNQAEWCPLPLQAQQEAIAKELQEHVESEPRLAEDPEWRDREEEGGGRLEVENPQTSRGELQTQSQEVQFESTGSDGQVLSESRAQPLAPASHAGELARLRQDFEQQQQRDKAQHESELEQLRLYFEKKLGDAEKNYQEALTVLQQRLRGARGESAPEPVALSAVPEEASGGGGRGRLDPPGLHLEQHEASLHAHTMLEESPQCQVAAQQEGDLAEIWMSEQRVGLSEEPGQDLAPMCLRAGGDTAVDVDTVVAARVLALEAEHKVKLSLLQTTLKAEVDLLKEENRRLCEKLQREVCLKEGQEKGKHKSVDGHQEELRQAEGQIRLLEQESREREAEWEATGAVLQRDAEEQLSLRPWGLRRQAEADRQSVMDRLARRETEMRQLQEQQAAQILDLEGSLMEQQGRLRQLELGLPGDESPRCSQCGREPGGSLALTDRDQELTTLRLQEDCALQLMLAQNRFLEQRKEISEKFAAEQDAFLREAREKHASELQLLQDRHQQHIVSLRTDLEARHQADVWELKAAFEREQRALSDTRVAELQAKHAADIQALETRHLSSLDAVESRHLSEVQALRDEHRRALEQLRAELEEQLPQKCSCHHAVSTRELETLQRECDGELQSTKGCPRAEPRRAHQGESHSEKQGALRERKERPRPASAQAPSARPAESEVASLQLREKDAQILQLEERVLSLRREVEGRDLELETLQRRRDRENQEGTNLIAMLRSDVDLSHGQRMALQDALRRLLGLFGETLQAAVALRSRIGERVGLCLEDEHPPDARLGDPALTTAPAADELWPGPDGALPELDATLPACSELSSVAEVSSHVRESFLLSPERALECEEPVRGVYRSLGLAVDSLLDMVLDSARQLEEARQIHARLEKEFSCKDEEVAQVVREHRALLERLEEESVARTRLTLELHKAEGVIEGFKVEKAGLQEALGQKEAAERDLVVQLESLSQQLQRATRQQAELEEENAGLWHQKDAAAAEAQAREAALRREVENASREQVESRRRCEKDRRALLAQVGALEAELEEQLSRQQATAVQASELCALRQQVESLDKHLRGQRQFMDEQAVEREHEREEFQQEIRRLEEQLRRAARPQPRIPSDGDIELLQEKLKEKSDEFDELVIKKELADRQVLIQEEEIKHLKETNADTRRKVAQLQEELEELRQDKVASQGQARSSPLLSTQRTAPEEDSGPSHPVGHCPERPEVPLEALQSTEVLDLKEQLEKIKGGLVSEDEALQLNVTLDVQSGRASTGGLEDESAAAQDKEELLEDCKLRKVDLITQVKQLQENLNRLVHSMKFQNIETEEAKSRQPLDFSHVSEDSLSDSCSNSEGSDTPPPDDTLSVSEITWGLTGVFGNQGSWVRNEMPGVLPEEKADLRGTSLCLHVSSHGGTRDLTHSGGPGPLRDALGAGDLSSWSSPEVVRKDSTLELLPSLPVTPCSEALSQRSLDTSLGDRRSTSLLQADPWGLLCSPGGSATVKAPCWTETPSATDRTLSADHHVQRVAVEKDIEDFITTSLDSQDKSRSPPPVGLEGKLDGSGKSDDGTGCAETLDPGLGGREAPTASPAAPWPASGSSWWPLGAMEEQEVWPKHMEAVLQMVRDESRHILALSEYRGPPSALSKGEPSAPLERFLRRDQGLWEAGPALEKGEKGPSDTCLDWREQFLQVVQEAFAKEREMLAAGLQPRLCGCDPGAPSALSQNLEKVAPEQGDLQETSSEHLHLSDRSSLLSEIQALRAQLRRTHLQNQEKLQQLCAALTSTEARGSRREHQLRRQVELLAYKVEQEKCIASGLQKTLSEEQERANDARKLLAVEQSAVRALRAELCECRQDNERLLQSLGSVQREVLQLRSMLDSKENDLRAALQELEGARGDGRALQSRLEQEQLQHLQREAQSQQALGELRSSLEKQRAQNSRLSVALEDEQTAKDNLRKELQIESSRCEALLAQERGRLSELRRGLQAEQGRTRELSEALQHERLLTEQLSRRTQACAHPAAPASPALLQQLQDEKARGAELQAALEEAQQHTAQARELEAEARARCEELRREKEVSATPRSPEQAPPSGDQGREGDSPAWLQAEVEQLQSRLAEQGGRKDSRRRAGTRQSRADADPWRKWQRDKEKLRELELQRQRHEHKIQQLQRTARELQAGEAGCPASEAVRLQEQQQGLEKIRQQLLCAAGLLTSFVNQTVDRTMNDWMSSNEKAVTSLLRTLEELKSELSASGPSPRKMAAEDQAQLLDVLLKDNASLTQALRAAAQEKAGLRGAAARLERALAHHVLRGCVLRPDRSARKRDRTALQSSPGRPDAGLPTPAAREEANAGNVKMEKLYLRCLRAESFRKALIYQKKYLLLLIGGFQDSEQETLSMIAHLGVFPSKADKIAPPRPFTKFRTAVRVVIAISRLRFLVRKWQEVDRKGTVRGRAPRPGVPVPPRRRSPPETSESPPTRDVPCGHARNPVPRASPHRRDRSNPSPASRSERSLTASQDPERSLTEYIHHLETIQQRLGGVPPDRPSQKSCRQRTKQ